MKFDIYKLVRMRDFEDLKISENLSSDELAIKFIHDILSVRAIEQVSYTEGIDSENLFTNNMTHHIEKIDGIDYHVFMGLLHVSSWMEAKIMLGGAQIGSTKPMRYCAKDSHPITGEKLDLE